MQNIEHLDMESATQSTGTKRAKRSWMQGPGDDEQQLELQRLAQCVDDDERARLGARAIEFGSTMAVAAAGADAIAAMAGATSTSDANNKQLQSCLPTLTRRLQDHSQCTAEQTASMLRALAKICQLQGRKAIFMISMYFRREPGVGWQGRRHRCSGGGHEGACRQCWRVGASVRGHVGFLRQW